MPAPAAAWELVALPDEKESPFWLQEVDEFIGGILPDEEAMPPDVFCADVLGHDVWETPKAILSALTAPNARVAVKSCHSSGKTHTAAEATLWWVTQMGGICITTAPTNTQVRRLLWGEVKAMHANARQALPGKPLEQEYRLTSQNYALGFSTNESVRFQGFHGDRILIILDEAPGVRPDIDNAIEGIRAGGDVRELRIGNPVVASGPFYEAFTSSADLWQTYTISAFDTPNFTTADDPDGPLTLEQMQAWRDAGLRDHPRLDIMPRPYLVQRRWVWERLLKWGEGHPEFQSRVLGEFPDQAPDSLVALSWCEHARARPAIATQERIEAGIDVAGPGKNETVGAARRGPNLLDIQGWEDAEPQGAVIDWLRRLCVTEGVEPSEVDVKIDSAGMGTHFVPFIREAGFNAIPVNVGERSSNPERYLNKRGEYYWGLRERLREGEMSGLTDTYTISQLTGIRWRLDTRGRVVIESKDEMAKRGVPSPDRADAVMLAFCPAAKNRPTAYIPPKRKARIKRR